ncbi:MAG TPA: hypothetical protein VIJ42_16325 [Stellaceae bacterium]
MGDRASGQADRALAALTALERCYDGPIPEPLRRRALSGCGAPPGLIEAEGQADFFAGLVRAQIAAIRVSSGETAAWQRLHADLALYRQRWRWWRREMMRLRGGITPSAGDAP